MVNKQENDIANNFVYLLDVILHLDDELNIKDQMQLVQYINGKYGFGYIKVLDILNSSDVDSSFLIEGNNQLNTIDNANISNKQLNDLVYKIDNDEIHVKVELTDPLFFLDNDGEVKTTDAITDVLAQLVLDKLNAKKMNYVGSWSFSDDKTLGEIISLKEGFDLNKNVLKGKSKLRINNI